MLKGLQTGVTLIEAMIAVALVALIVLTAMPSFSAWLAGLRVRTVAESLVAGMQLARVEAVKRNTPIRFTLDSATGGGWTVLVPADSAVIATKATGTGGAVAVTMDPNSDNSIEFANLGQRIKPAPGDGDMTVSITNPAGGACQTTDGSGGPVRCLNIQIPAGGQVRLCDPVRPDGDPQAC